MRQEEQTLRDELQRVGAPEIRVFGRKGTAVLVGRIGAGGLGAVYCDYAGLVQALGETPALAGEDAAWRAIERTEVRADG